LFLIKNEVSLGKNKFVSYLRGLLEMSFLDYTPLIRFRESLYESLEDAFRRQPMG
jgi:hypothetical protein